MDDFEGYKFSWMGFIDYAACFPYKEPIWIAVGACLFLGTLASVIPQIITLIIRRSNFGLSPFMIFMNNFSSTLLITNIIALRSSQFRALGQYSFWKALPTLFTFFNNFLLWFFYIPVVCLTMIFFDVEDREKRNESARKRERIEIIVLNAILFSTFILTYLIFTIIGVCNGFSGEINFKYGKTIGIINACINVLIWMPQIITTCRLKDPGSLSIVMLILQAPGGLISTAFMAFGQKENWTTWLPIFCSCCQQILLLSICIFYECRKRHRKQNINLGELKYTEPGNDNFSNANNT